MARVVCYGYSLYYAIPLQAPRLIFSIIVEYATKFSHNFTIKRKINKIAYCLGIKCLNEFVILETKVYANITTCRLPLKTCNGTHIHRSVQNS